MPSSAPMVTTPVPPTPVMRMFQGWLRSLRKLGVGNCSSSAAASALRPLRGCPPCTVTKLGQNPDTQE
ncbi:hypothetical protein NB705_002486 [Xanthomonas sacchari]|nr:hypothetical protein [Xanthomonas sacchari]MCW0450124.1 hypothetical protein [Xanthomonas sacchari]MCW0465413.1 hypothetical protein [Xanthomonas sacchari]